MPAIAVDEFLLGGQVLIAHGGVHEPEQAQGRHQHRHYQKRNRPDIAVATGAGDCSEGCPHLFSKRAIRYSSARWSWRSSTFGFGVSAKRLSSVAFISSSEGITS